MVEVSGLLYTGFVEVSGFTYGTVEGLKYSGVVDGLV